MQTYMVESLFCDVRQRAGFKPGADVLDGMSAVPQCISSFGEDRDCAVPL